MRIGEAAFEDGAVLCNDPSEELLNDVKAHNGIHKGKSKALEGSLILTLGTGSKKREMVGRVAGHGPMRNIRETWRRIREIIRNVTSSRAVRERMARRADSEGYKYFVWDGGENIGDFGLDDCEKFAEMKAEIDKYMRMKEHQDELRQLAELLVKERRRRFDSTPDRWQRYAYCTMLRCPDAHCKQARCVFRTRADVQRHVDEHHRGKYIDPQGTVDEIPFMEPCHGGPWCLEDPDIQMSLGEAEGGK